VRIGYNLVIILPEISFNFHWFSLKIGQFYYQILRSQPKSIISICVHFLGWYLVILVNFLWIFCQFLTPEPKSIISICVHFSSIFSNLLRKLFEFCHKMDLIWFSLNFNQNGAWIGNRSWIWVKSNFISILIRIGLIGHEFDV